VDAEGIVAGWKQRLLALAENQGLDYRDTPQELIDREHARLTTFAGYPEADVAAAEERLGVRFPAVFRQYLLELAKSSGELFHRSDLAHPAQFERFRFDALALLSAPDPALPREAVVFRFHQHRWFTYVLATGAFDSPTVQWDALLHEATHVATGFAAAVDAHLQDVERRNRERQERGDDIRTMRSASAQSTTAVPAPVRGERPPDRAR
jgi:hypothetical protein